MRNAGALMLLICLSGCSSMRLHSEVRDKQGQAAQEAFKKVDLSAIFSTASDNLNKQLDTELDSQDRMAAAIRAQELAAIVLSPSLHNSLVAQVDKKLLNLAGGDTSDEARQRSFDGVEQSKKLKLDRDDVAKEFRRANLPIPSCKDLADGKYPESIRKAILESSGKVNKLASLKGMLDKAKAVCQTASNTRNTWVTYNDAEYSKALAIAIKDQAEYDHLEEASKIHKGNYDKALAEYDALVKLGDADNHQNKVQEKAKQLKDLVDDLDKSQNAISVEFISNKRIEVIQSFVDVVLSGLKDGAPPAAATTAQAAFILIPEQIDGFKSAIAAAQTPMIEPLAIRKNLEQIKLDAAKRELALIKRRIQLSNQIADALYVEMAALARASRQLHEPAIGSTSSLDALYGDRPVVEVFDKVAGNEATNLYDAVATYLDDLARLTPNVDKLKYQRLATYHQVSLVYAETNARQWMNLIAASVDQTAESANSGLKPETVTQAIQAAALSWIAHGVN